MKAIFFTLVAIGVTVMAMNAYATMPFSFEGTGASIRSYQLDSEVNSVILVVDVSDSKGTLAMTFDREFFDAIYQDQDDEFLVLIDGDQSPYEETKTTSDYRSIEITVFPDIDEVEIFGSHLMGKTIDEKDINIFEMKDQNVQLLDEKELLTKQVVDLSSELEDMKTENTLLQNENEELDKKIFNPDNLIEETGAQVDTLIAETEVQLDNLIEETEVQAQSLSSIIMEQFNAISAWFRSFF